MLHRIHTELLIYVAHSDWNWLVQFFDGLLTVLELALDAPHGKLDQLVFSLFIDYLTLEEVFLLF